MRRMLSFLDEAAGRELILPVTPPSYTWDRGSRVETVQLDQIGEVNLPGAAMMGSCTLEVMLPARLYSFCNPGTVPNPYIYLEQLERWSDAGTPVRFLVSGTPTNALVLIETTPYGERDGTNDLYVTLNLRQYRKPQVPVLSTSGGGETGRDSSTGAARQRTYTVAKGDTLWGVAKKFYGDGQQRRREKPQPHLPGAGAHHPGVRGPAVPHGGQYQRGHGQRHQEHLRRRHRDLEAESVMCPIWTQRRKRT